MLPRTARGALKLLSERRLKVSSERRLNLFSEREVSLFSEREVGLFPERWLSLTKPARPLTAALALAALLASAGCSQSLTALPTAVPTTSGQALAVTSVADGDTFTGRTAGGVKVKVRMLGIDAPELAHDGNAAACGGPAAATELRSLIGGSTVTLVGDAKADDTDKYGRSLRYVGLGGRDVALELIQAGLVEAWYPSGEPRPERFAAYRAAEDTARAAKAGLWGQCSTVGR